MKNKVRGVTALGGRCCDVADAAARNQRKMGLGKGNIVAKEEKTKKIDSFSELLA